MKRRDLLIASAAMPLVSNSFSQSKQPIADSHNHFGLMMSKDTNLSLKLGDQMRESGVTLLSWSIIPDGYFLGFSIFSGIHQKKIPDAGELKSAFDRQIETVTRKIEQNNVRILKNASDLELAANGTPFIVLTSEGADFLESDLSLVPYAYDKGLRHLQLVHYIKTPVGDRQTDKPEFNGLSEFGKSLIPSLNQTGILIDLAHSTPNSIDQALELSKAPLIWSHGFVSDSEISWTTGGYRARGLPLSHAKKIAVKGGAVGLWALGATYGNNLEGYANEIMRMVDLLGVEHVMFGTDEDGLPLGAVMKDLIDLRKVVDILEKRGVNSETLQAITFGNYARCLRTAMAGRTI